MATILIVDDVAAHRTFLVSLLGSQGHRPIEASDGAAGLAAVAAERPDLVITDVLMPVMDGYEFVRQLRDDPATSGIPVLFYTAPYSEREARSLVLSTAASYVLRKPAPAEEVLEIVGRLLGGVPTPPPEVAPAAAPSSQTQLRLLTDRLSEKSGDLRAANARLRALINIGLELASTHDSDRLLQAVCADARDLFGATYTTLGILSMDDLTVRRVLTCGTDADWITVGDPAPGVLGAVISERRTFRGENPGGSPAGFQLPPDHPEVQAFLAAPIASSVRVYGWICLVCNEGRSFSEDDEDLVTALAGQVGRIYEIEYEIGERKEAESALRRERDQAKRYLDTAEVILLELDTEGRVRLVNRYACSMLGWAAEDLLGKNWIETCMPPRLREELQQKLGEVLDGQASVVEYPILTRSGEERVIAWRNTLLLDEAGAVTGTLSSGVDVTERTREEQATRERARLSALGAAIGLSLTHTDSLAHALQECAEALVTHLDAALVRIWTLEPRERALDLVASAGLGTPSHAPHTRVLLSESGIGQIARDGRPLVTNALTTDPQGGDLEWVRRDGIVAFAGYPLIVDGLVVGVLAIFAAQTLSEAVTNRLASIADHLALGIERHRGVASLRIAEERMRYALQSAHVGIWDMDYVAGTQAWSETLETQYGLAPGTFEGTFEAFTRRIHPEDREGVLETVGKAVATGSDFTVQHRSVWDDGTVRWLSGAGRIYLGERGEPVRAIGISQDVTERRTLELQYQQSQKMEAIGRLAGGVAHDFNNLLTAILGYCELLLTDFDPKDPRQADIVEIQKAGQSAAALTRQLLAFSRKQIIEPTVMDLSEVVGGMRALLVRLIGENVRVVLILPPGLAPIRADRSQVEQIILNLAVNARDSMPDGGVLTMETANVELDAGYPTTHFAVDPGPYVVLSVNDTGTGMSAEVQARLFEPFFTTKPAGKGTGLGLATVHGIIKQSGGSVNVYSELGRGTLFKVYFPRVESSEVVTKQLAPPVAASAGDQTVLLVEDAAGLRELTKRLLERLGYTVLVASNADEAVLLFKQNESIDVLLTDVVMPGASGPELTRQLVQLRPALHVVYMSGYTEDAIVQHGVLLPGIAFLHKPFTSETLGRKLREVLDRQPVV